MRRLLASGKLIESRQVAAIAGDNVGDILAIGGAQSLRCDRRCPAGVLQQAPLAAQNQDQPCRDAELTGVVGPLANWQAAVGRGQKRIGDACSWLGCEWRR